MLKKMSLLALSIGFCLGVARSEHKRSPSKNLPQHVHGGAMVDLAIDGKNLFLSFEIPGASLLGFEHQAENQLEKKLLQEIDFKLSQPMPHLFVVPQNLHCQLQGPLKIENIADENHFEYRMEIQMSCQKSLINSWFELKMFSSFSKLKKVTLNILRTKGNVEIKELTPQSPQLKIKL